MMRPFVRARIAPVPAAALAALLVAAALPATASSTRVWSASRAPELARGTLDGTMLDDDGGLSLAPPRRTVWGPEEGIVWAVADDGDGGAFVALSGPGRVLRAREDGTVEAWWDGGDDVLVTALVPDGDGGLFVGLSPEGKVLHLAAPERIVREYDTGSKFVWAVDVGADGALWIGTGTPGAVRVRRGAESPDAELETVWESGEDPVRVVRAIGAGALAGTGGEGHVVRIDAPAGGGAPRAYVAYDAEEDEIVGVAGGDDGTIFALAAAGAKRVESSGSSDQAERTTSNYVRVTATPPPGADDDGDGDGNGGAAAAAAAAAREAAQKRAAQRLRAAAGGTLYRIEPGGAVRALWDAGRNTPFALARAADGRLLVATGDSGHVFGVDADGRGTRLLRIPSAQVSALAVDADGALLAGGTGDARVERIGAGARDEGAYRTPAIDAETPARWGRLRWRAEVPRGAAVEVAVRVGNTEEPGAAWTDWSDVERRDGDAYVPDSLPAARRLQARFTLRAGRGGAPRVTSLEIAYRPGNRPPVVEELAVREPGVVWTRIETTSTSSGGPFVADDPVTREVADGLRGRRRSNGAVRRVFEPGMRTFTWSAEDPDDDRLRFALALRAEGASGWTPLVDDLEDPFWSWDSRAVPDGIYRVRLTASDDADRPRETAREHRFVSDAFRVDHTRPRIEEWRVARRDGAAVATFVARDPGGALAAVEWSTGDGPWRPLAPEDGLVDGPVERFRLELGADDAGAVRVRATDRAGNVGGALETIADR